MINIERALEKLYSMHQFGIKLGLDNISRLLAYIGDPQKKIKSIHIAGSNGKGSTASFTASVLMQSGFKTALYTSPHYIRFNERIKINGVQIDDEYIANFVDEIWDYIEDNEPTFFEVTTALAFKYFAEKNVDYAVIETGLGGRLDATNVLNPLVSIITTIGLEHTNILGETIELIAAEKGGIIKNNVPVVIGQMPIEAENVLEAIAQNRNSEIMKFSGVVKEFNDHLRIRIGKEVFKLYSLPLAGYHQKRNAALAVLSIKKIFPRISASAIFDGIKNSVSNIGIQGKYEVYSQFPKVVFDSAHNADGIKSFIDIFEGEYKNFDEKILIFGVMRDKNIKLMLNSIRNYFDRFYFTNVSYERAATADELIRIANELNINADKLENPSSFINSFLQNKSNNFLAVIGSIYLLGDIKVKLLNA